MSSHCKSHVGLSIITAKTASLALYSLDFFRTPQPAHREEATSTALPTNEDSSEAKKNFSRAPEDESG
jgi:hypothetical protein